MNLQIGLMNDEAKLVFLGTWMALFVEFYGRKFTQPIKDDIGDKTVFMFMALPEDGEIKKKNIKMYKLFMAASLLIVYIYNRRVHH
ncbi:unnamed protein product [Brassica oleracea var. botrytis]|uniref:Uncharacterized protein n=1 Tax=Brassica oleracea TaxID=3712 RepID=A0A3P6EVB5_BRAOL|nr:unnamed protein product [Brassica oleracea]